MTAEVLGFLIIMSVLLVVVFRQQLRQKENSVRPEIETSAERLRYEIEQSAQEVISRLNERIDRLERLVEDADQRSAKLEWQISYLSRKEKEYEEEIEEIPVEKVPQSEFSNMLVTSLKEAELTPESEPIRMTVARSAYTSVAKAQQKNYKNIEKNMALNDSFSMHEELVLEKENDYFEEKENKNEVPTIMIKKLLAEGYSVEEISKRVKLGRGAIELIRQMEDARE